MKFSFEPKIERTFVATGTFVAIRTFVAIGAYVVIGTFVAIKTFVALKTFVAIGTYVNIGAFVAIKTLLPLGHCCHWNLVAIGTLEYFEPIWTRSITIYSLAFGAQFELISSPFRAHSSPF